jgi:DNA modification methylase
MILTGDALDMLRTLPDESVNCCVTSPPYYGLRDYGVDGQIGLEPTLQEYLAKMAAVFEEVRRVLRKDGTCWVNMGDSYASTWSCGRRNAVGNDACDYGKRQDRAKNGFKEKDLMGVPWRLAFALQDAGWYLRSEIVWHKPNPMPESVQDRPTRAHETIFLLTKSSRYWYDADAIRTVESDQTKKLSYDTMDYKRRDGYKMPDGWATGAGSHGTIHRNGREKGKKNTESGQRTKVDLNANWDAAEALGAIKGANARTVWTIATCAYPDAHFATFPPEIPKRCILAGCPIGDTVLDPFAGSGTTLAVAHDLGREFIGIELNPEYVKLIEKRLATITPSLFKQAFSREAE